MTADSAPAPVVSEPEPPPPPRTSWRRVAKLWGFAAFVVVVAWLFRHALLPFILAVTVAYILAPVVNRMSRWHVRSQRMPRWVAVILCYVVVFTAMGLFLAAFLPRLSRDIARLGREVPGMWVKVDKEWTPRAARWLEARFPSLAPAPLDSPEGPGGLLPGGPMPPGTVFTVTPLADGDYAITVPPDGVEAERLSDGRVIIKPREDRRNKGVEEVLRQRARRALAGLEGEVAAIFKLGQALVAGLASVIMKFVLVFMVAAFILIDIDRLHSFGRGLIPGKYRSEYDLVVAGIDRGLNGVIRGQLLICLVNFVLTYVGLFIFEVKYGLLLALLAGLMSLIPIFGSILSSIPIVSIALVSGDSGIDLLRGVCVLGWILGIHFLEANVLNPKIIGTAARMHPVLVIFALIAGEVTYGLTGALLAVPAASIIQTLFVYFRSRAWRTEPGAASSTMPSRQG